MVSVVEMGGVLGHLELHEAMRYLQHRGNREKGKEEGRRRGKSQRRDHKDIGKVEPPRIVRSFSTSISVH